ncbi:MAG: hypothetical protein KIT56_06845 [Gammaproteobacteria bacterium]|nr:hypothetical protein [Gammaproteobacteria bacterium]MCW5583584.1 hypothetical protein [Gammaproteobacteria bacterium]
MYFFLENRIEHIIKKINRANPGLVVFKNAVHNDLTKDNNAGSPAKKAQSTAHKIANTLLETKKNITQLNEATKSVSGMLCSFFLPWTSEYELRKRTASFVLKAENKFSKLTNIVSKYPLRPKDTETATNRHYGSSVRTHLGS